MEYFTGLILGLAVASFATAIGLDRDRGFYPTVLIVVAAYYVLFAAMGAPGKTLGIEIAAGACFLLLAVYGFKRNSWLVAAALAGHGVFDLFHGSLIENTGVPVWWPGFCATVDLILGGWLASRLLWLRGPPLRSR